MLLGAGDFSQFTSTSDVNNPEVADSGSGLFCYYQSVQYGYDLGPSVSKCTVPGHDACMLLENTHTNVKEMSCISLSDCETTRRELVRSKLDDSVKLTCCTKSLCNDPNKPVSEVKHSNLRDHHPLQHSGQSSSSFKEINNAAMLAHALDASSLGDFQFRAGEPFPSLVARGSRGKYLPSVKHSGSNTWNNYPQ